MKFARHFFTTYCLFILFPFVSLARENIRMDENRLRAVTAASNIKSIDSADERGSETLYSFCYKTEDR